MSIWLLVLMFAGPPPQAHVYGEFTDEAKCERLAAQFNADKRLPDRSAACVPWRREAPR
jgi:hypothetical protein